jgi:aminopeptidase N
LPVADTATDGDYQNIDRVVAHEYFHNWTGNRVTCRDWFQLSLKEGLTVFRDQEFGADMHSRAVTRIRDVRALRAAQFPEDAGPMAHPVRPDSYIEINNFYTSTVYEKGAEVVRMIQTLIGRPAFRRGMDLYFERHDGQAVTCDDFVAAMADASGVDLRSSSAGTTTPARRSCAPAAAMTRPPALRPDAVAVAARRQATAAAPFHIPVAIGLNGRMAQICRCGCRRPRLCRARPNDARPLADRGANSSSSSKICRSPRSPRCCANFRRR